MSTLLSQESLDRYLGQKKVEELWQEAISHLEDNQDEYLLEPTKIPHDIQIVHCPKGTIIDLYLDTIVCYFDSRPRDSKIDVYTDLLVEILIEAGFLARYHCKASLVIYQADNDTEITLYGDTKIRVLAHPKYLRDMISIEDFS